MKRTLGAPRRPTALVALVVLLTSMLAGVIGVVGSTTIAAHAAGRPSSPTDATKVPHYFGPWPNWANKSSTWKPWPGTGVRCWAPCPARNSPPRKASKPP